MIMLNAVSACGADTGTISESESQDTATETETDTETDTEGAYEPSNDAFVRVRDYIPTIQIDLRYATTNNFTGQIIYTFDEAYLRYGTVLKLQQVAEELEAYGYGIKIWDAFRPLQAQRELWQVCPDERYVSNPDKGKRNHCRGLAIDITLYDLKTGEDVEMPSGFDEFSEQGNRDYSDCTKEAADNAEMLETIMMKYGFTGANNEWWHYSDTDTYPLEEQFVPKS